MKSLAILFMLLISMMISGQAPDTVLIYTKRVDSEYSRAFLYSTGAFNTYTIVTATSQPIEPMICGVVSPNGLFDAFADIHSPTMLSFLYMPTNEIFAQIIWNPDWDPCTLSWLDNETLIARHINTFDIIAMFKIQNNILQEVPVSLPSTPTAPELPFAYDTDTQYIIPSNNHTKFFYQSCPNEPVIPPDQFCAGSARNNVIYDLTLQRNVGVITDSVPWLLSGQDIGGPPYAYSIGYHSWSPDDRYFWYSSINEQGFDDFRIYDTVTERQLDTSGFNWSLDLYRKPIWSPDSRRIAFWMVGPPGYENVDPIIRSVNVYDTTTQHLIPLSLGLELGSGENPIIWSPNTPEFVTWDSQGNLYRVNVETGSHTVIDTNVTGVLAWSYVEPIPTAGCNATITAGDALGLVNAINTANNNGASADTICLEEGTYTFLSANNSIALPSITTPITIVGNGEVTVLTEGLAGPAWILPIPQVEHLAPPMRVIDPVVIDFDFPVVIG